jgi:hypothetical protein
VGTALALVKLSPLLIENMRVHDLEKKTPKLVKLEPKFKFDVLLHGK